MSLRLKPRRSVVQGGIAELRDSRGALGDAMVREMRKAAPVDTGALKRSIKRGRGKVLVQFDRPYGLVQNVRGPHKGWIDRAEKKALNEFDRR